MQGACAKCNDGNLHPACISHKVILLERYWIWFSGMSLCSQWVTVQIPETVLMPSLGRCQLMAQYCKSKRNHKTQKHGSLLPYKHFQFLSANERIGSCRARALHKIGPRVKVIKRSQKCSSRDRVAEGRQTSWSRLQTRSGPSGLPIHVHHAPILPTPKKGHWQRAWCAKHAS